MVRLIAFLLLALPGAACAHDPFADPQPADVPQLIEYLGDANLRQGAARALVSIGPPAVPALKQSLQADNLDIQIWSAYTLGELGSAAASSTDQLIAALDATDMDLRAVSARALGRIGVADAETVAALAEALSDDESRVRKWSAEALGRLGPAGKDAAAKLRGWPPGPGHAQRGIASPAAYRKGRRPGSQCGTE